MPDPDPAPETWNDAQEDAPEQAQTLADEARGRAAALEYDASDKPEPAADDLTPDAPDLLDRMNQMVSSGRIDMGAFRGERNDDDVEGAYGPDGDLDDASPYDDPERDGL